MNYYLDQEFNEYFRKPIPWLPSIGKFNRPFHTIELISIGLVAEDGREYYAVCNEFNVTAAYNKYQLKYKKNYGDVRNHCGYYSYFKEYWLRDNVLKPIFMQFYKPGLENLHHVTDMSLRDMKSAIKYGGKSKKKIREEVFDFISPIDKSVDISDMEPIRNVKDWEVTGSNPVFYGYFADYDWVLFCSLFGTMMDLPKRFPMYCKDLQQIKDDYRYLKSVTDNPDGIRKMIDIENHPGYPAACNEHHALSDAKWNKKLHDFLRNISDSSSRF